MAEAIEALRRDLERIVGLEVLENEPLSRHTSFGIGGPARLFLVPHQPEALVQAVAVLSGVDLPRLPLGRGTNLLVADEGFDGVVIAFFPGLRGLEVRGRQVVARAGTTLGLLCHAAADAGLSGLEFAAGIPGTLGGALIMNAGANGGCIADNLAWATVVAPDGEVFTLRREELEFSYRDSSLKGKGLYVLEAGFELAPASPADVHRRLYEQLTRRCQKQPLSQRSAGSVFKRPEGDYAGRLLEQAGLKGERIGDAQFSPKHANFIVNVGRATARDVVELIKLARARVYERWGVWLELEICVVGDELQAELAGQPGKASEGARAAD